MKAFALWIPCALFVLSTAGCRTSSPNNAIDPREMCDPESAGWGMCRPEYVAALTLDDLRRHDASLLLTCDYWSVVDAAYETECREGTVAAVRDLETRFPEDLEPIPMERLEFKKAGTCIDVVTKGHDPGQYCFDYLQVSLPLRWKR